MSNKTLPAITHYAKHKSSQGFTLIELSIVLVIIGLVVGGIVVGKDLIKAAEIRSLLSQVDSFKLATNTFKEKYGAIPGDISVSNASRAGLFTFTGTDAGREFAGDGSGKIESVGFLEYNCYGECGAFWRHLSDANLIQGNYGVTLESNVNGDCFGGGYPAGECVGGVLNFTKSLYMPKSKLGVGFFGVGHLSTTGYLYTIANINSNRNAFYIAQKSSSAGNDYMNTPSMSASTAHTIDLKIDDGQPNSGGFLVSTFEAYDGTTPFYQASPSGANSVICTKGGAGADSILAVYNSSPSTGGNNVSCVPIFVW